MLTIASVVDYSRVLQYQGKYKESLSFSRLELSRAEHAIGSDDPNISILLADIASIYSHMGFFDKAVEVLRRELGIREKTTNYMDLVRCLYTLGTNMCKCGQQTEGVALCQRALSTSEQRLGTDHFETVSSLYHAAEAMQMIGNYRESMAFYRQGLAVVHRKKMNHPLAASMVSACSIVQRLSASPSPSPLGTSAPEYVVLIVKSISSNYISILLQL